MATEDCHFKNKTTVPFSGETEKFNKAADSSRNTETHKNEQKFKDLNVYHERFFKYFIPVK